MSFFFRKLHNPFVATTEQLNAEILLADKLLLEEEDTITDAVDLDDTEGEEEDIEPENSEDRAFIASEDDMH